MPLSSPLAAASALVAALSFSCNQSVPTGEGGAAPTAKPAAPEDAPKVDPAAPEEAPKMEVSLVVEHTDPRQPQWVGVRFEIEPGWHIYWINPGETGLPTTVAFQGPAGTTFGDVAYPAPERLVAPGGVRSYGYENEVVLLSRMEPGPKLAEAPIEASASWLVCKEACIRGKQKVTAQLKELTPQPALIGAALSKVPKPLEALRGARVQWEPSSEQALTLRITPPAGQAISTYFEGPAPEVSDAQLEQGALRLRFRPTRGDLVQSTGVVKVGDEYYAWQINLPE